MVPLTPLEGAEGEGPRAGRGRGPRAGLRGDGSRRLGAQPESEERRQAPGP